MKKTGTQTIETERLVLRRFVMEDAPDMYRNWASDPEVTRYLTWPAHTGPEITSMILKEWIPQYEQGDFFNWAIIYKENSETIGNISVVKVQESIDAADIGYCLGRAYWGRGIMPEALKAVIDWLIEEAGMNRVAATHDRNNPKSGKVMQKSGMQYEGVLRQAGRNNQGICDEVWYSILRSEWEKKGR